MTSVICHTLKIVEVQKSIKSHLDLDLYQRSLQPPERHTASLWSWVTIVVVYKKSTRPSMESAKMKWTLMRVQKVRPKALWTLIFCSWWKRCLQKPLHTYHSDLKYIIKTHIKFEVWNKTCQMQLQDAAGVGAAICGAIGAAICGAICGAIGCGIGCGTACGAGCRAGCMGGVAPGTSNEMYGGSANSCWPLPSWQNMRRRIQSELSLYLFQVYRQSCSGLSCRRQKSLRQAAPVPAVPSSVFLSCAHKVAWSRSMDPRLRKLGHVVDYTYSISHTYVACPFWDHRKASKWRAIFRLHLHLEPRDWVPVRWWNMKIRPP